ncbi:MAG: HIT domain-containing protein [Candidatus Babeliales bacterium]|jgi:ATP adenylyltransferase
MKHLYAPWRQKYVTGMSSNGGNKKLTKDECVFCKQLQDSDDDKYFIIKRFKHNVLIMNRYPYNAGHLLILPLKHHADLDELTAKERAEMMEVLTTAIPILGAALGAEGFNVGINLGIAGGGGIPSHLHMHLLPRWRGDTNFLETLGQTKVISSDIVRVFEDLKTRFAKVTV